MKNYRQADKQTLRKQGKRLEKLMATLKLNQSRLAEVLSCKQPLISNVIKGDIPLSSQNKITLHKKYGLNILWYDEGKGEMFLDEAKMAVMKSEALYTPGLSQKRHSRITEAVHAIMERDGIKNESEFCLINGLYPNYITEFTAGRLKDADKLIHDVLHQKYKVNLGFLFYDEVAMFEKQAKLDDDIKILSITVDRENNELSRTVPAYAQAGYLTGYRDPEYLKTLPEDSFFYAQQDGSYRTFEIIGDSMEPSFKETDFVRGKYLDPMHWRSKLRIGEIFIIVHKDGVVCKQLTNHQPETGDITLHSFNDLYDDRVLNLQDVYELWYYKGFFSRRSFRG